jgi:hypothetical protein
MPEDRFANLLQEEVGPSITVALAHNLLQAGGRRRRRATRTLTPMQAKEPKPVCVASLGRHRNSRRRVADLVEVAAIKDTNLASYT